MYELLNLLNAAEANSNVIYCEPKMLIVKALEEHNLMFIVEEDLGVVAPSPVNEFSNSNYASKKEIKCLFKVASEKKCNLEIDMAEDAIFIKCYLNILKYYRKHITTCESCGEELSLEDWEINEEEFIYLSKKGNKVYSNQKIGYKEVITEEKAERMCDKCEGAYSALENYWCDNILSRTYYSHGVATGYSGTVNVEEIDNRFRFIANTNNSICCSYKSQHIGAIGVYVKGTIAYGSNIDLGSYNDSYGNKIFNTDHWRAKAPVKRVEDLDFTLWDHTEFILYPEEVVGIWVKDWALKSMPGLKEYIQKMKEYGIYVRTISNRKRG